MKPLLLGAPFGIASLFFGYEWLAVSFPRLGLPSWSDLVSATIPTTPALQVLYGFAAGAIVLVLFLHFARLLPWWEP